jgi:hypothetical protein
MTFIAGKLSDDQDASKQILISVSFFVVFDVFISVLDIGSNLSVGGVVPKY